MAGQKKIEGIPVVDATKPVVLHIGALDIPKAKAKSPSTCVAARACMRDLNAEKVRVHLSRIFVKLPGKRAWVRFATPAALRAEIIAFDRGGKFVPGDYKLTPLPVSKGHDYHKKSTKERTMRKTGKKRAYHVTENVRENGHSEY